MAGFRVDWKHRLPQLHSCWLTAKCEAISLKY